MEYIQITNSLLSDEKEFKIIIPHLRMLGGNPIDFHQAFEVRENVYFDIALASADMVMKFIMKFIEKIGYKRILFDSDTPFGTMK
jgi:predicted TIM-barrel fold metal-dependent hydrolase